MNINEFLKNIRNKLDDLINAYEQRTFLDLNLIKGQFNFTIRKAKTIVNDNLHSMVKDGLQAYAVLE